jgi:hypothetical protein
VNPTPSRVAAVALAAALVLSASCAKRVPIYSPRLDDSADHRASKQPADCLACHGGAALPESHSAGDPCLKCHKIILGVAR